jgi:mannose-1-phosphate guanylyltransferase
MIHAVIMAGGVGTRFWPRSRRSRPKQFLRIGGDRPMIEETRRRLEGLVPPERTLVVTSASQVDLVREACPDLPEAGILAEPRGRNTAPCIALAALRVVGEDPDGLLLCLPADHVIRPAETFREAAAAVLARADEARSLLTFGIPPSFPSTGFGYIECGERAAGGEPPVHRVARFVEKPDRATAERYVAAGTFLWNSGMFAWRADVILEEMRRHLPEVVEALEGPAREAGPRPSPALAAAYDALPGISIDYGIMEKAARVEVVPAPFSWDDVGSWRALERVHDADEDGNVARGRLLALDAAGVIAVAEGDHTIAAIGVEDLIVIHTEDVTLVCPKDRAEDVKRLVDGLKESGDERLL